MPINDQSFFNRVYALVQQIPPGYVTTYGDLARALGTRDARRVGHLPALSTTKSLQAGAHHARTVGWALHANKDQNIPCHRVVAKDGRLSESYAFGGSMEQYVKLIGEGVPFLDRTHVDLTKSHFIFDTK